MIFFLIFFLIFNFFHVFVVKVHNIYVVTKIEIWTYFTRNNSKVDYIQQKNLVV